MKIEVLKGTGPTTLTKKFGDGDQVDAGAVTYAVTDAEGDAVASGTANKTGAGATTAYDFALAVAAAADVGELTVVWTRPTAATQTDTIAVVGSVLFTEADARGFAVIGNETPLSGAAFTDQKIAEGRYLVTEFLERRCEVSFTRRYARVEMRGTGTEIAYLSRGMKTHGGPGFRRRPLAVVHASLDGTALTAGELASVYADREDDHLIRYDGNLWSLPGAGVVPRNVVAGYEYGYASVPWEMREAGLRLLVKSIVPSDVSRRAQSRTVPDGTSYQFILPSAKHPTGDAVIDEAIASYREAVPIA